jgi:hypothetical protein
MASGEPTDLRRESPGGASVPNTAASGALEKGASRPVPRGPPTDLVELLLLVLAAFGVVVGAFLEFSGFPRASTIEATELLLPVILLLLIPIFVLGRVRSIALTQAGIQVDRRIGDSFVAWADLLPPPRDQLGLTGLTFAYRRPSDGASARPRGLAVSWPQARAIVENPSCPRWDLPPRFRSKLDAEPVS